MYIPKMTNSELVAASHDLSEILEEIGRTNPEAARAILDAMSMITAEFANRIVPGKPEVAEAIRRLLLGKQEH